MKKRIPRTPENLRPRIRTIRQAKRYFAAGGKPVNDRGQPLVVNEWRKKKYLHSSRTDK
jgi:hypothetical protein